ncbi:carbohydrate-binding protein [Dendronalium sp. ChiSLP03b]|uniref:carbohydrate-binding protein n=1 Tax=Dendronalium sp. ChiSLP03b TaxID=3075381 RepID=UPI002AD4FAB3|nr:carbohydrate-binding protein [Dendronalium sp. ChiSLP03b]MDZ8203789.1 carbohydrate-binding protein [Dendronalium sp. ChiSLP03b]
MFTISNDANVLRNRNELKSLFKNKSRLSETHFAELINSMLNKQDDRFHGLWQEGRTYRKGDVVYYQGALWEMQAETEICANEDEAPGTGSQWKSLLKELEQKVNQLQHDLAALTKAFTEYQEQMKLHLRQLVRYITLLTLGLAIAFVWLLVGSTHHIFTGTN